MSRYVVTFVDNRFDGEAVGKDQKAEFMEAIIVNGGFHFLDSFVDLNSVKCDLVQD